MAYWLDDGFDTWPEVAQAGTAAVGLYVRCGAWIARNLASGRIDDAVVPASVAGMYGTVEWRRRLVDAGLWATEATGYRDLRHFDLNPTREQIEQRRAQKAAAGRKGGLARSNNIDPKRKPSKRQARASPLLPPLPFASNEANGGARAAPLAAPRTPEHPPTPPPDHDQADNPDWRHLPAFGAAREPDDAERTRTRIAEVRAQIRPPNDPPGAEP